MLGSTLTMQTPFGNKLGEHVESCTIHLSEHILEYRDYSDLIKRE
jgi:hypothetical protein